MKTGKILPLLVLACATPAYSLQFKTGDNIQSALDVTLTYGAQWRIDDPEKGLIADPNLDDANRNFDSGIVSNGVRAIIDFESRYNANNGVSYGVFARGSAWYDNEVYGARNDNDSPLTTNSWALYGGTMDRYNEFQSDVEERSGADVELLDLFLFANMSMDSLDYAGPKINEGSKGVLLGLGDAVRSLRQPECCCGHGMNNRIRIRRDFPGHRHHGCSCR